MEVDGKTVFAVVASLVGGIGGGVISAEIKTQSSLAAQQVQIDNIRRTVVSRIAEHKADLAELRAYIDDKAEDVDERIDRLDERKMDR